MEDGNAEQESLSRFTDHLAGMENSEYMTVDNEWQPKIGNNTESGQANHYAQCDYRQEYWTSVASTQSLTTTSERTYDVTYHGMPSLISSATMDDNFGSTRQ